MVDNRLKTTVLVMEWLRMIIEYKGLGSYRDGLWTLVGGFSRGGGVARRFPAGDRKLLLK